ncbi:MAG TPA: hypothetical protein VGF17_22600 [Phytomonospora sp.]
MTLLKSPVRARASAPPRPAEAKAKAPAPKPAAEPGPPTVLDLQRTAGNRAVTALITSGGLTPSHGAAGPVHVQRAPKKPSVGERLAAVEQQQAALAQQQAVQAKRVAALEVDARWRARFGEKFADYEQVILRMTGGIATATEGFTNTHQEQAQADALAVQVMMLMATVGVSAGLEWALTKGLGGLGMTTERIERFVEVAENPLNTAAQGSANVYAAARGAANAQAGKLPETTVPPGTPGTNAGAGAEVSSAGGGAAAITSPIAFLTSNLEALAAKRQGIEGAFGRRRERLDALTPEAWAAFDPKAQEAAYERHFKDLERTSSGISMMRSAPDVALIIERRMWSKWILKQDLAAQATRELAQTAPGIPLDLDPNSPHRKPPAPEYSLGGYVEDRLTEIRMAQLAGVVLTGHWYSSNSPDDWHRMLFDWADNYHESVGNA